jgi:hypothetical protein
MGRVPGPMLCSLALLALSSCTTEPCDCLPIVPAIVTGHVVRDGGVPVAGAIVNAFSGPGAGCESLDTDFGLWGTGTDGGFRLDLASGIVHEGVCVLVFAQPPEGVGLGISDTVLLVMDFRDEPAQDSAQVELVLGAE